MAANNNEKPQPQPPLSKLVTVPWADCPKLRSQLDKAADKLKLKDAKGLVINLSCTSSSVRVRLTSRPSDAQEKASKMRETGVQTIDTEITGKEMLLSSMEFAPYKLVKNMQVLCIQVNPATVLV